MPEENLTFEQVLDLSIAVKAVADGIANYQLENFQQLSTPERRELTEVEFEVRDVYRDLLNEATQVAWEDMEAALEQIEASTSAVRKTLKKITAFRRALSIAAGVIAITGAIATAKAIDAANSTAELLDLFNKFKKEDEDAKKAEDDAVG